MRSLFRYSLALSLLFLFSSCKTSEATSQTPAAQEQSPSNADQSEVDYMLAAGIFTGNDKLSYNGYDVVKLKKIVNDEDTGYLNTEISYLVVKRGREELARFEGVYFSVGNATDFGLFSLLRKETRQLIASQTVPRGGRHWIADLSDEFRIIFDSYEYAVGREELELLDIDKDGVYEIGLWDPSFYMVFGSMSMAETPLPKVYFKYDDEAGKYLPANHLFQDYALRKIEDQARKLNPEGELYYLSDRLRILLDYLYAGKEEEGWAFFYREYRRPDVEEIVSKTKAVLSKQPAYLYIKNHSSK